MAFTANLDLIPITLVHETREGLSRLCWMANTINQVKYNYSPFQESSEGWVTTFFADIKDYKSPEELSEDEFEMIKEQNI